MKFQTQDGQWWSVHWRYGNKNVTVGVSRCTICLITSIETKVTVSAAEVACYHKDSYSKESGRKRSLTKALSRGWTREERTAAWKAYFNRIPPSNTYALEDPTRFLKGLDPYDGKPIDEPMSKSRMKRLAIQRGYNFDPGKEMPYNEAGDTEEEKR